MIKILVLDPTGLNPATDWRLYGPFGHLRRRYRDKLDIHFSDGKDLLAQQLRLYDILVYYITLNEGISGIVELARSEGVKTVLDCDDNVFNLHPSFPGWEDYYNRKNLLTLNFKMADEIWFSTQYLSDSYHKIGPNRYVMPNGVMPNSFAQAPRKRGKVVCWRGTEAHIVNLEFARGWYKKAEPWADKWIWFGYLPPWASMDKKNSRIGKVTVDRFLPTLMGTSTNIIWKPLEDCPQYRAITPISFIEATQIGAVAVSNFSGLPGWEHTFSDFQAAYDGAGDMWHRAVERCRDEFNLEHINERRLSRIIELAGLNF